MKCKNCNKEIEYVNCHYFDQRVDPVSLGAYESEEYYQAEIKAVVKRLIISMFLLLLLLLNSLTQFLIQQIVSLVLNVMNFHSIALESIFTTKPLIWFLWERSSQMKLKLNDCIITSIEGGSVDVSPTCLHAGVVKNGLTILKLSSLKVNL